MVASSKKPEKKKKKRPQGKKCIVKDCQNHKGEGEFVGRFCRPCWRFIKTGRGQHSQLYRNALAEYTRWGTICNCHHLMGEHMEDAGECSHEDCRCEEFAKIGTVPAEYA